MNAILSGDYEYRKMTSDEAKRFIQEYVDGFPKAFYQGADKPGWLTWATSPKSLLEALMSQVKAMVALVGPEERQAVLDGASQLYDVIVAPALPIALKPFSSLIKKFVINAILEGFLNWLTQEQPTDKEPHEPKPTTTITISQQAQTAPIGPLRLG